MRILSTVSTVVKGLRKEQAPKLLESIATQCRVQLEKNTLKTGIFEDFLVGIDANGRFIATRGEKLANGDFGTVSRFGKIDSGAYSKIISETSEKNHKGILERLSAQIGFPMNMDRTKIGMINGKLFGIDDNGRFIFSQLEPLTNGKIGTISRTGIVEGTASKVVPSSDLLSFKIIKRT